MPDPDLDRLVADIGRLLADARIDDAALSRSRQRRLQQLAEEEATFTGVLVDLAERGVAVAARTADGLVRHGRVAAVGRDFVVLAERGRVTAAPLRAVSWVRPEPGAMAPPAAGARPAPLDTCLADALPTLAAERPDVQVWAGGEVLHGELRAVGDDVLSLRLGTRPPTTVYVPLASVAALSFLPA